MAKKNFETGIGASLGSKNDTVFRLTGKVIENDSKINTIETETPSKETEQNFAYANYNIKYPKTLQRRIKQFCLDNDGIDMKDVFIEGTIMYLEKNEM